MSKLLSAGISLLLSASCASLQHTVVFWSRQGEIESTQQASAAAGIEIDDEAYKACLKRWPYISHAGLQRRALMYSLLQSQNRGLDPWLALNGEEDLGHELGQISVLRRRSAP